MSDFFENNDPNELLSVGEMMIYDNQYVVPLEEGIEKVKLDVGDNESRITALEHQIPGGGGGTGAFLNLGGVPERYPLASECVGAAGDESGFMVVARPDGVYFYNPTTKQLIEPKKGGGSVAVQGQLPEVFLDEHKLLHSGRASKSGLYLANYDDLGITQWTNTDKLCTVMIVAGEQEEQQTVFSAEGVAYRVFPAGVQTGVAWVYHGTGGGSGDVDDLIAKLEAGNQIIHPATQWNYTGVTSKDMGAAEWDNRSYFFGIGSADRAVQLPTIVPRETKILASGQIREGRVIYIGAIADSSRTVKVATGQKFFINGSHVEQDYIVPPRTTMALFPSIFGNGTCSWIPTFQSKDSGAYSIKELADTPTSYTGERGKALVVNGTETGMVFADTPVADITRAELADGSAIISPVGVMTPAITGSTQINQVNITRTPFVITTGGTRRFIMLPEIVGWQGDVPTTSQIRNGRFLYLCNNGSAPRTLRYHAEQPFRINGVDVTGDRDLPANTLEVWYASLISGAARWIPVSRVSTLDQELVGWKPTDRAWIDGVQTGNVAINGKSWGRPTSLITGTTISADQLAAGGNIVSMPTAPCTATVPKIVGVSATTLASNEVRLGTEMAIYNHGTAAITINFVDNRRWVKGVESMTGSIGGGKFTRYLATHISGSNYCWVVLNEGNTGK